MILLSPGCATWRQRTIEFHDAVYSGNFDAADQLLAKSKGQARKKNRILYHMNKGYVKFMQGDVAGSNEALEKAETLAEDQRRGPLSATAAVLTNPEARPYRPEDFELIMINFYKAMNYLRANDREGALVEARKINLKLDRLNDKYPDHKNRYQRDAFAHLLMALIYDASRDDNNAFVAYRNAYDVYRSDYAPLFGIAAPEQLKRDLLRSAYRNGFMDELKAYEREFGMTHVPAAAGGDLVFFWLNGLGPVKERSMIHLVASHAGGIVTFQNEELGLSFPFVLGAGMGSLSDTRALSIAFPRYAVRPPFYVNGRLTINDRRYPLEMVENINEIALKTLRDRAARELFNTLSRLVVKTSVERIAREQNPWLGLAVGIFNSATETVDTRNWQTLPYAISYARVPLAAGDNEVTLECISREGLYRAERLRVNGDGRGTVFHLFQTMR
ncbi:MAG: hypothetical protein LBK12_00060 [Odoribacteraceae bacterium]|nr:hypothetical protein [Odoribacteraceae bacterium]